MRGCATCPQVESYGPDAVAPSVSNGTVRDFGGPPEASTDGASLVWMDGSLPGSWQPGCPSGANHGCCLLPEECTSGQVRCNERPPTRPTLSILLGALFAGAGTLRVSVHLLNFQTLFQAFAKPISMSRKCFPLKNTSGQVWCNLALALHVIFYMFLQPRRKQSVVQC